ncbi:substrate-binding domain-containing protein [Niallia sp. NCCP-28]|uniref:substrate-binding domain-containing protein n=1 Tax=Niallia sp. NCCP-28 TaxID=2934712 RepID=UPI00208792DF|nr:substrate-binding domain-containing protein [Niallia sp. NCCP-28]GKU80673.1 hypothetical protein NCCP28_00690 [Niallia sp. NCCP-28]
MTAGIQAVRLQPRYRETLTIGALNSLWSTNVFHKVTEYSQEYQDINLRLITGHTYDIIPKIQNGSIDIGFVNSPPCTPFFKTIHYKEESIQLVGSPKLVKRLGTISTLDLPYIHFHWGMPFTEWFEEEIGKQDTIRIRVDNLAIVLQFILQGKGIGFLLDSISRRYINNGQLLPIKLKSSYAIPARLVYIIYAVEKANKIKEFLDYINQKQ